MFDRFGATLALSLTLLSPVAASGGESRASECVAAEGAVAENVSTKPSLPLQEFLSTWRKCLIHPVARSRLLSPEESDPLQLELFTNQLVQISSFNQDVPAQDIS